MVGSTTLGFADFLVGRRFLPMAAESQMDLEADRRLAGELAGGFGSLGFEGLCELSTRLRATSQEGLGDSPLRRRARDRFNRRLARVDADGASVGGAAMLAKIDAKLSELGRPPLTGKLALEAGGGVGLYLCALSDRFDRVLFVDASLANLVLAAKVAEEHALDNVAWLRADVMSLPLRRGIFDFIHQNGVIEHVRDPVQMALEAARIRSPDGCYVCVSPNRNSLTPEPHFRLPAFGLLPPALRRKLVPLSRGLDLEEAATEPLSLRQLRRCLRDAFGRHGVVFFLPRRLEYTARQTPVRRLVLRALSARYIGRVVDYLLNVLLLPLMPQHIAIEQGVPSSRGRR